MRRQKRREAAAVNVRKGAWTAEEDILLRNCIEKYGEGKWHQVPYRAGLNRCRKSCRLRWLNYLRPDIKRGYFSRDEVDLIVRLHKLLGNRWSLIAGRLPGRTANDVKNFWNTHIDKKSSSAITTAPPVVVTNTAVETEKDDETITVRNIFRPRPWNFLKSPEKNSSTKPNIIPRPTSKPQTKQFQTSESVVPSDMCHRPPPPSSSSIQLDRQADQEDDDSIHWWRNLLVSGDLQTSSSCLFPAEHANNIWLSDQGNGSVDQSVGFSHMHLDDIDVFWTFQ